MLSVWNKLNVYLGFFASFESASIILDAEFWLVRFSITWNSNDVVDIDLGSIGQVNGLFDREFVRDSSEIYDFLGELERRSNHMPFERQRQHFWASF